MAQSPAFTLTGTFSSLTGSAEGIVRLTLVAQQYGGQYNSSFSSAPRVNGTAMLAPITYESALASSFSVTVFGNDVITPAPTVYLITIEDADGNTVASGLYNLTGSGSNDLSTLTPINGATPPTPPSGLVNAGEFYGGPEGSGSALPVYRSLVDSDLPANTALKASNAAATQFVDATDGNDSNDGLSWGTAKATLGAAIGALPSGAWGIVRVSSGGLTLTANLTITRSKTTIVGEPGANITGSVAGGFITVQGCSDIRITGLTFISDGTVTGLGIDVSNTVSRLSIDHCQFENFPYANGGIVVAIGDTTNSTSGKIVEDVFVCDNRFLNCGATNIYAYDWVARLTISRNWFETASTNSNATFAINLQTVGSGTSMNQVLISENTILSQLYGGAIQVQKDPDELGGNPIYNCVVDHNVIVINGDGGGISIAGVVNGSLSHNAVDATNTTYAGSYAPLESVNNQNFAFMGNTVNMGTQGGNVGGVLTLIDGTSDCTCVGNAITLAFTGSGVAGGVYVGTTTANANNKNILMGNTVDLTGSTGKVFGIWLQVNNSGGSVSNNLVAHNVLVGANVSGDAGIAVENDAGAMAHNILGPNEVYNFNLPFCSNFVGQDAGIPLAAIDPYVIPAGGLTLAGDPASVGSGYVALGATTGVGNGSAGNVQAPAKSSGSGPTTPGTIVGWIKINVGGTTAWIPYAE